MKWLLVNSTSSKKRLLLASYVINQICLSKVYSTLSFSKQISSLSSTCHYHIRDLRRIRHNLDFNTATTIATALVHSRLDYCNPLYRSLPITQIKHGLARAVTRTPKHSYISPVIKSLHWLKVEQRLQYKIIFISHNLLHITEL